MISFLRKKINKSNKVVFINKTDLKPRGRIAIGGCPVQDHLYVSIDIKIFESLSKRLLPGNFLENI